ncbi:type I phosphomannose isomerase catalytic subunit [uncultured Dokdonia sp.]|uniref:type I phosphomannose isomerase catalytic subunit n=1 Tax=uncultured Dokdonia sp. TaxID=575653 RepID=UPI002610A9D2|nr:type I phosphomannose isomerase catalytic subunit [uncultured Dokdonia sp.]
MHITNWYPLQFQPILKEKIWGGQQLKTFLSKTPEDLPFGESWEIADLPEDQSVVTQGVLKGKTLGEVVSAFAKAVLGTPVVNQFGENFPLLIKYIDAADDLSVQLHPDDTLAKALHQGSGKTEMWYIMKAVPGAQIIVGFEGKMTPEKFDTAVATGTINDHLQYIDVTAGDCFFISAGLIHAIGKGIVLAEIQQTSDITYRVYDYHRKQPDGSLRDLHIENARKALQYTNPDDYILEYDPSKIGVQTLKHCPFFKTDIIKLEASSHTIDRMDSFTVLIMVAGNMICRHQDKIYKLTIGETLLIPADCTSVLLEGTDAKFLEVYL